MKGWFGVDLDGNLAKYEGWKGEKYIGEPIAPMVERVKNWLANGNEVRIVTARVSDPEEEKFARPFIEAWCLEHIGQVLPITCCKDYGMIELWDDRCVRVETNTGRIVGR